MLFSIEREEAERYPWWYGHSYTDWSRKVTVLHPIPLNWLVRVGRNLVAFLQRPRMKDWISEYMLKRRMEIWDDGYQRGKRVGYTEGYMDHKEETEKKIEKLINKYNVED